MKLAARTALLTLALVSIAPVAVLAEDTHAADEHDEAHEAEHGGHGELSLIGVLNSTDFWAQVFNFLGLVTILVVFGRKPLQTFLETRRQTVEIGIAEGTKLKLAAEAKHKEYSERIAQIDEELAKLRSDILKAARTEKERIIAEAEERAKRTRAETDELIAQQMQQLQVTLSREVVDAAVSAAEKILQGALKADDQQRLAQDYVKQVASLSKGGRA